MSAVLRLSHQPGPTGTLDYLDAATAASFSLTPETAVSFFQAKGLKPTFAWQDMIAAEHDAAFTVAKMMEMDLLKTVRDELDKAISQGRTFRQFKDELIPVLQKAGWWGRKEVIDPATGETVVAELGSPRRLETIFRTNLQSAYSVGAWEKIEQQADQAPYLLYDAVDDHRTREQHRAWDGVVRKWDDKFWKTHYPPNGWNCRCGAIQLTDDELEEFGLKVTPRPKIPTRKWTNPHTGKIQKIPEGLDPGWDHNPGIARMEKLKALMAEKAGAIGGAMGIAAQTSVAELEAAKQATKAQAAAQLDADIAAAKAELVKEASAEALKRSINKAVNRAAAHKLATIEAENLPYLGKALQAVQGTKAGAELKGKALLDAVEAKAEQMKQSAHLAHYKQAVVKGKAPSAKAQAAYDALPDEAKAAIDESIAVKKADLEKALAAEKAQAEAKLKIQDIQDNPKGQTLKAKALKKLQDSGEAGKLDPVALLAKVEDEAAAAQAKASQAAALSGYKKKVLEGKIPTPAQQKAFNALAEDEQAAFLAKIDDAKAAAAPKPVPVSNAPDPDQVFYHGGANVKKLNGLTFFTTDANAAKGYLSNLPDPSKGKVHAVKLDLKNPATTADVVAAGKKAGITAEDLGMMDEGDLLGFEYLSPHLNDQVGKVVAELKKQGFDGAHFPEDFELGGKMLDGGSWVVFEAKQIKPIKAASKATAARATKKAAQEAVEAATDAIDTARLTKIGGQKGSNPGGLYQDPDTGEKWYIKTPKSEDIARNEILAAKLYEAAGIDVPELRLVDLNGSPSVASKVVDGLKRDQRAITGRKVATGAHEGFAADAWLANWDVVGLDFDNLLVKANRAIRIDTGGALRYRAQGGLKGRAWGSEVTELDTLRDSGMNPQAASVFGSVSKAKIVDGVRRILAIDDAQIRRLVDEYGPTDAAERTALADTLIARKQDLARRYPEAVDADPPEKIAPATGRITEAEARVIDDARQNGYSVPTDGDQIEDQAVLFWHEKAVDGTPSTRAMLKVRGKGRDAIEGTLPSGTNLNPTQRATQDLNSTILQAVKGIAHNAGKPLRAKDIQRIESAVREYERALTRIQGLVKEGQLKRTAVAKFKQHYEPWIGDLQHIYDQYDVDEIYPWQPTKKDLFSGISELPAPKADKGNAITWTRQEGVFRAREISQGYATESDRAIGSFGHYYEAQIDGVTVRYWPDESGQPFALRGRVELVSRGTDAAAAQRALDSLGRTGVTTTRATDIDREELYLVQVAYHRRDGFDQFMKATQGIDDQAKRVQAMRDRLSKAIGKDVATLPGYKPSGEREAFGHGYTRSYRPDLDGPAWDKFAKQHALYHSHTTGGSMAEVVDRILNSGGKMAPTTDKLRRGIPIGGMSPTADLRTGGASYFFTRIVTKRSTRVGFYWSPRHLKRLDAISYDHDAFGEVKDNYVMRNRRTGIEEWQAAKARGSNETIFKGGLSLFDDLERIVVGSQAERRAVIEKFKQHGYDKWPDGRRLEDVIVASK